MATEADLAKLAVAEAKATTISWDTYLRRIASDPNYDRKGGHWYKAGTALEAIKHPSPPPVPPHTLQERATRIIFCSDHALYSRVAHSGYARALTADPGEEGHAQDDVPTADIVKALREVSTHLYCWGNQTQIGIARIKQFCSDYKLDGCIYQSENQDELASLGIALDGSVIPGSLAATELLIHIGNPTAWTAKQRETVTRLIAADRMAVIVEVYSNVQPWLWPNNFDTQGVPEASWAPAFYNGKGENPQSGRYVTVDEYAANTRPADWPKISPYVTGSTRNSDLAGLP